MQQIQSYGTGDIAHYFTKRVETARDSLATVKLTTYADEVLLVMPKSWTWKSRSMPSS